MPADRPTASLLAAEAPYPLHGGGAPEPASLVDRAKSLAHATFDVYREARRRFAR